MFIFFQLRTTNDIDIVQHLCDRVEDVCTELSNDVNYIGTMEEQQKLYSHKRTIRQRHLADLLKLLKGECCYCLFVIVVFLFYRHWFIASSWIEN
jgi:hypothetical protein